jgi:hypothetical protein
MNKKYSIRDILKFQNETSTPLGILLYTAASKVVTILCQTPNKNTVKISENVSPLVVNQVLFSASVCFSLVMVNEDERDKFVNATIGDIDILYDMSVDFLRQFPTPELARENFPRPVVFSDNSVLSHALDVTEQIKNLTINEAHDLILAQPLVRNFKDNFRATQMDAQKTIEVGQVIELSKVTLPKSETQRRETRGNVTNNFNITIGKNAKVGDIVLASTIQNSFNKVDTADIQPELKETLKRLATAVDMMNKSLPEEKAAKVAEDLGKLVDEATKSKPNKKWYSVSVKGLINAAKNLDKLGEPVINLSRKVLFLLTGGVIK